MESVMTTGRIKFLAERWRSNLGVVSFLLMLRVNLIEKPIWWGWYLIGLVLSVIYLWIDMRYIYGGEVGEGAKKNPEWVKMTKTLEEIKDAMVRQNPKT
jgi:hypothetical protein